MFRAIGADNDNALPFKALDALPMFATDQQIATASIPNMDAWDLLTFILDRPDFLVSEEYDYILQAVKKRVAALAMARGEG